MANPQPLHRAPYERSARRRVQTPLSPSRAKATYPQLLYLSPRRTQSAARKPQSPRCTIASGASHGRIRLTQPGRITQREAVRADGARQLKKHPGVTMPSDTRRKQPSPPHSAVDTRLAAKRAFVGSRLNPKRASQSKRIGPGTRSYTSLNPNPSRTYGKNRLSSAQTAPTTFIRASPGTSTRAISSSPSYRR